jgi:hypothetical protein
MSRLKLPFLALLAVAAGTGTIARAQSAVPAAPTKKVWTNDDVSDLRDHSEISTFAPAEGKTTKSGNPSGAGQRGRDAKWYHDQIAKLEAQIPLLDGQIAALQSAIDGTPAGDQKTSSRKYGAKGGDWRTELEDLRAKRGDIEAHISALQDEARHHDVPSQALP